MKMLILMATGAALAFSSGALAQSAYWTGDTTSGPTMLGRPSSFTFLSSSASNFHYHSEPFYVSASGEYTAESNTNAPFGDFDGYLLIYGNSFDPTSPLANLIAGDDDFSGAFTVLSGSSASGVRASRIILGDFSNFGGSTTGLNLTAGVQYYAVQTSYGAGAAGSFEAAIGGGPGQVHLGIVPAPGTLALLAFGGLAAARRRR